LNELALEYVRRSLLVGTKEKKITEARETFAVTDMKI
jgi:hypothetical protein